MDTSDLIWPNFDLIRALMYVIITSKYKKDPIKSNREKVATHFFQIITLAVAMETSGRIWPNFELIQALRHVLIAYRYEKDLIKMQRKCTDVIFSIISLWDFFQLRSLWSDLAEFRTHSSSYVLSLLPASMKWIRSKTFEKT